MSGFDTRFGSKRVVIGEPEPEAVDDSQRVVKFTFVFGLKMTDDELDQFGGELVEEIAKHVITDQAEKAILVDWKDIRELPAREGVELAANFKQAVLQNGEGGTDTTA